MKKQEIQIRRVEKKSHLDPSIIANTFKTLGSIFVNDAPLRGLNKEEENHLMPKLLGIDEKDPNYHEKVRNYWLNKRLKIPVEGLVLNVTLKNDKGLPDPVNLKDYIDYRWALSHSYVAEEKEKMQPHQSFYLYNPEIEKRKKNTDFKVKRKAYIALDKMEKDSEKKRMILSIIEDVNVSSLDDVDVENTLIQSIENNASNFLKVAEDKNLEMRAFITKLISKGILSKIGNSIYFIDDKLGSDFDETILYLKDKANSAVLMKLKEKDEIK